MSETTAHTRARAYHGTMVRARRILWMVALAASARAGAREAAWQILKDGIKSDNLDRKRQAIAALGSIGAEPEVLRILHEQLHDKNPLTRQTVVAVLGQIKAKQSIPYLKSALKDTTEVSFTAAKALADIGDMSGAEIFEDVITGERSESPGMVKGAMRDARTKMRNPAALALMGIREASGALLGPASMGILVAEDALKDKGAPGRILAAQYLAKDPDAHALAILEWALGDKNWAVRAAVARVLGERGDAGTIARLEPLFSDDKPAPRHMAAASVIRLSAPQPRKPHNIRRR